MPVMKLTHAQTTTLLGSLEKRFKKNMTRHAQVRWDDVARKLDDKDILLSLFHMEETGGEPDVIGIDNGNGLIMYADCSAESPMGRRSLCYDQEALDSRKEAKPKSSAMQMAAEMGIRLMDEEQYRHLQTLGEFDLKTSSWLLTPDPVRSLGGAIFGDRRYDRVFIYHNGAQSYYAARGFRGILWL